MNKELLNQFVDTVKHQYDTHWVYIETDNELGDFLVMKSEHEDFEIHLETLYMPQQEHYPLIEDIRNIYLQFHREHLLDSIL